MVCFLGVYFVIYYREMLKDGLNANNYVKWFQTLLWLEEMQMEIDIGFYNMPEAPLKRVSKQQYSNADCVELQVCINF